jgi:hypothetical protein
MKVLLDEAAAGRSLINRLVEIFGPRDLRMSELPLGTV